MLPLHAKVEVNPGTILHVGFLFGEMYVEVVGYKNTSSTSNVINKKFYGFFKKLIKTLVASGGKDIDADILTFFIACDALGAKLLTASELIEFKNSMEATIKRAIEMKHRQDLY